MANQNDQPRVAQTASSLTCGVLKAILADASTSRDDLRTLGEDHENGILRDGPRFDAIEGAIWSWSSPRRGTSSSVLICRRHRYSYGRQQIDRRGSRFVLPIQAKARLPAVRAAFRLSLSSQYPADPINRQPGGLASLGRARCRAFVEFDGRAAAIRY